MRTCPVPTARAIALLKSLPTPSTQELLPVVTNEAVGAPVAALLLLVAPIAPPGLTPAKLITVIDATTLCDRVAETETALTGAAANAPHISAEPLCTLVRLIKVQASPAPVTLLTAVLVPLR